MNSRRRSSPVIIPPSFVATILPRSVSALWARAWRRLASGSVPSFAARSLAWSRRATIASTADVMRFSMADSRVTSSNGALRSSTVYVARGSSATSSDVESTSSPFVMRTVYFPGGTRGPKAAPKSALAAGGTRGGGSRIDHSARLRPRRLLLGTVSTTATARPGPGPDGSVARFRTRVQNGFVSPRRTRGETASGRRLQLIDPGQDQERRRVSSRLSVIWHTRCSYAGRHDTGIEARPISGAEGARERRVGPLALDRDRAG